MYAGGMSQKSGPFTVLLITREVKNKPTKTVARTAKAIAVLVSCRLRSSARYSGGYNCAARAGSILGSISLVTR